MVATRDKKQRIIADLTGVRIQVQDQVLLLRRKLNVGRHILESIRSDPWKWISLAAGCGWLLSRIPARKIYIYSSSPEQVKSSRNRPIGKLWKGVWAISKPLIATYLATNLRRRRRFPEANKLKNHTENAEERISVMAGVARRP